MSNSKERFARSAFKAASLSKSDRIESKEAVPSLFNFKIKLVENFETENEIKIKIDTFVVLCVWAFAVSRKECAKTLSITTFSITTLRIKSLYVTISINYAQHYIALPLY